MFSSVCVLYFWIIVISFEGSQGLEVSKNYFQTFKKIKKMIRNCVKRMKKSVVLVIADPKDPNVKVLNECMSSLRDGTVFHLGNDVESLRDAAEEADIVVHGTFAGGKAKVIEELYPVMKKNLKWVHSLSTGVDGLVPHLKNCPGDYVVSNAKGAFSSSLAYVRFSFFSFLSL